MEIYVQSFVHRHTHQHRHRQATHTQWTGAQKNSNNHIMCNLKMAKTVVEQRPINHWTLASEIIYCLRKLWWREGGNWLLTPCCKLLDKLNKFPQPPSSPKDECERVKKKHKHQPGADMWRVWNGVRAC